MKQPIVMSTWVKSQVRAARSLKMSKICAMSDELVGNFDRLYYGLDFGFAVDPLAYVAMYYDAKREDLYIFDELYRQKMTNSQAAKATVFAQW